MLPGSRRRALVRSGTRAALLSRTGAVKRSRYLHVKSVADLRIFQSAASHIEANHANMAQHFLILQR
jgi:hypothetical protein